jgi:putative ABC transport system substrate-binding protein
MFEALIAGLRERGYVEGRNIAFEHRFPAEIPERFRSMALELVGLRPDLLVGVSPNSAIALKRTGTSLPIVFTAVGDAVGNGLVGSVSKPGQNVTGFTILSPDLMGKRLQLLLDIRPGMTEVGVLYDRNHPLKERIVREATLASQALKMTPSFLEARDGDEIDAAFSEWARRRTKVVLVAPGPLVWVERHRIARAAIAAGIAETQFSREGVEAGSLFSYGANMPEVARQTADYIVRILLGARPGDLPVVQPSRFELAINLKTAKALGLTIPQSVLLRADRVIE